jgi:hypothetical protein
MQYYTQYSCREINIGSSYRFMERPDQEQRTYPRPESNQRAVETEGECSNQRAN